MGLGSPVTRLRGRGGLERGLSAVSGLLPNPPPPQKNIPPAITGRKRIHITAGQFPKWEGSHACFRFFQFGFFFFFLKTSLEHPHPPFQVTWGIILFLLLGLCYGTLTAIPGVNLKQAIDCNFQSGLIGESLSRRYCVLPAEYMHSFKVQFFVLFKFPLLLRTQHCATLGSHRSILWWRFSSLFDYC